MKPYSELLENYSCKSEIPYSVLLNTNEWNSRRGQILKRDKYVCQNCGKTETMSHYDEKTQQTFHLWFEEKTQWVKSKDGTHNLEEVPIVSTSSQPYFLHVHHHYYVLTSLPWEYPDEALATLCNHCHLEYHKNYNPPVYQDESKLRELELTPCNRCNGAGWLEEFYHVQAGICFRCSGDKYEELIKRL